VDVAGGAGVGVGERAGTDAGFGAGDDAEAGVDADDGLLVEHGRGDGRHGVEGASLGGGVGLELE